MGRYPVTQQQWVEIMGYNPSFFKDLTRPVESVSWDESCQFIRCLNYQEGTNRYRLPTEAEWEYVARCGGLVDPKKKKEPLGQIAWYKGNSKSESKPVGTRLPNPWGLYDMQGNVWEWVFDWFDDYPLEPCNDPLGPNEGTARVIRGGAWGTSDFLCHIHIRSVKAPRERSPLIGLRLVIEDSLPADGRFAIFNAGG
jgi:formylglycine-generating enzyme required for sulfatase activity